ncbi:MAG TPA: ATP-dependent sacrificial sulfur transferase LarE [Bacillota bacterium]|nr:ATP-dependent sacrificial sulfur transferase LarE [Bacillota bacterium]
MNYTEKLELLKENLRNMQSLVIAYSGGVDSTFLLKVAYEVLKEKVLAVTARSSTYPEREYREAVGFIQELGARHLVIVSEELDIDGFSKNPVNRCYYCKKELFTKIREIAVKNGIKYIADGSNVDDLRDYRPGMQAVQELEVVSPLREAGLTKEDIRILSKQMNLPTWDKPAFACLSSRFPYGQEITREKLEMVDKAEQFLLDEGFKQVRVRHHGEIARIEVSAAERSKFFDEELMDRVYAEFRKIGFGYTALDLQGYRTGSMNETIL